VKQKTGQLLDKAERAIKAAETLLAEGDADFAAGRAYYAMFYVAEALLNERGLGFSKHSAVHASFGEQFAKTGQLDSKFHRWLIDAFDKRLEGDYGTEIKVLPEDVTAIISQAREFLHSARRHLGAS
jgi:uncharacterized protein (UPF0332 family)